jgi:hypothetical protein
MWNQAAAISDAVSGRGTSPPLGFVVVLDFSLLARLGSARINHVPPDPRSPSETTDGERPWARTFASKHATLCLSWDHCGIAWAHTFFKDHAHLGAAWARDFILPYV